jgi:hypothetical protein
MSGADVCECSSCTAGIIVSSLGFIQPLPAAASTHCCLYYLSTGDQLQIVRSIIMHSIMPDAVCLTTIMLFRHETKNPTHPCSTIYSAIRNFIAKQRKLETPLLYVHS